MQIETHRLLLRPFVVSDEAEYCRLLADPVFMEWSMGGPRTSDDAKRLLLEDIAQQEEHGFSKFALIEKETGCIIGYCGLGVMLIEDEPMIELGFRLVQDARGKGFATEASRATIEYGFGPLQLEFIEAIVEPDNSQSKRLLDKLGFVYQRQVHVDGRDWQLHLLKNNSIG